MNGSASALAGDGYVGAVDLGGTKILAAVFAPDGTIAARAKKATGRDHSPAAVADRMASCVREAARAAGIDAANLRAVGVGAPGPIEAATGVVLTAPNLDWENVPLKAELEARLGVPVEVDNDVRVAVLAEHAAGAGRGVRNMVGIWPGTGVGGGVVLDGRLFRGTDGLAGEIGHITIKAGGPRCGCGGRGHLEALCSRTAIVRDIAKAARRGTPTALTKIAGGDLTSATSGALAKAWSRGDKLVTRVLNRAARHLAHGIASVANLLNPELVVLGGGVIEALGDQFVEQITAEVRKLPLHESTRSIRIARAAFGDDAGISGAALIARRHAHRA
jgi:glucokinase